MSSTGSETLSQHHELPDIKTKLLNRETDVGPRQSGYGGPCESARPVVAKQLWDLISVAHQLTVLMQQMHHVAGLCQPSEMKLREGSCAAHYLGCLSRVPRGPHPSLVQVAALRPHFRLIMDWYIMSPAVSSQGSNRLRREQRSSHAQ